MVSFQNNVSGPSSMLLLNRFVFHVALLAGFVFGLLALPLDTAWAHHSGEAKKSVQAAAKTKKRCGSASWYALDGRATANGEVMSSKKMTAAHKHLPFGSKVRVTNRHNGKSVVVRINDRGPFISGRVIDVTPLAARKLGFRGRGHAPVSLQVVGGNTKGKRLCA